MSLAHAHAHTYTRTPPTVMVKWLEETVDLQRKHAGHKLTEKLMSDQAPTMEEPGIQSRDGLSGRVSRDHSPNPSAPSSTEDGVGVLSAALGAPTGNTPGPEGHPAGNRGWQPPEKPENHKRGQTLPVRSHHVAIHPRPPVHWGGSEGKESDQ